MLAAIQNIPIDVWFFTPLAVVSVIGLCMALRNKSPRTALAIVSLPGFAFQIFLFGVGIHSMIHTRSGLPVNDYLFMLFFLPFFFNVIFFGQPLISFLVMAGVVMMSVRRNHGLVRWTPATSIVLALTILSYAIFVYRSYTVNLPN